MGIRIEPEKTVMNDTGVFTFLGVKFDYNERKLTYKEASISMDTTEEELTR